MTFKQTFIAILIMSIIWLGLGLLADYIYIKKNWPLGSGQQTSGHYTK